MNYSKALRTWEKQKLIDTNAKKLSNEEILNQMKAIRDLDTPIKLNPEGAIWFGKALGNYFLNQWNKIYNLINKNIDNNPEGSSGKKIADSWRNFIDEQTMGMNPEAALGLKLWQEVKDDTQRLKEPQPMLKQNKECVPLYLNPKALEWINKALNKH